MAKLKKSPLTIPLSFDRAVEGLLGVKPTPKKPVPKKKPAPKKGAGRKGK